MSTLASEPNLRVIESRIRLCYGRPALLAVDLAECYDVSHEVLLECVQRHGPLPGELRFRADAVEAGTLPGDCRAEWPPEVFTEHGALAAAYLIGTDFAIAQSIHVLRAFARRRSLMARGWRPD
jgi:hypothetical protein